GSFHGRTTGALACTGQEKYRAAFGPLLPGVTFVPWGDTVALARAVGPTTAAVILEPVQGEGGLRPAPSGYLEAARQLCDTHGAILIFDEVQTGMGRSGKFFAYQHGGAVPDALTTAKALAGGLPMGALLTRGRAAEGFSPGDHASTFGGGPLVSRVALAMLRELEAPGFLEHVAKVGAKLGDGLAALARELPQLLAGSRGRGMMQGLVFREPVAGEAVNRLRERGYLTLTAGPTVLRLVPPLVLTEAEADDALGAIGAVVRELAGS
ncbi:MAG: aspartate aminotransferase family protein, partial [Planctomycetota bacterium]